MKNIKLFLSMCLVIILCTSCSSSYNYNKAYISILNDVLTDGYEYLELDYNRSALIDLDNDGKDELIYIYFDSTNLLGMRYSIWTSGINYPILTKDDELCSLAGKSWGGINLVTYGEEEYLCVWNTNTEPSDYNESHDYYDYQLFTYSNNEIAEAISLYFDYYVEYIDGESKIRRDKNYFLSKDENEISVEEFIELSDILQNPTKVLCEIPFGSNNCQTINETIASLRDRLS